VLEAYEDHWALVTGASAGIGAEFARQLAGRGMHLVLTARRQSRLEDLAAELENQHRVRTKIIPGDLADPEFPARLLDEIGSQGIELELLVNNAGFGSVGVFDDADVDRMLAMVRLNITSLTELTYRVLPSMLERKHGAVINVSSVAAMQPVAYMPVYAASKAFVLHFSEALWAELRDRGVTVMALCPGTTETEFFDVAGVPGWLKKHSGQSARDVVRRALKALDKRRSYVVTGWWNYLLSLGARFAPRRMVVMQTLSHFRATPKQSEKEKAEE